MKNIILFATYWNEIEWIKQSLDQILEIDPIEIIICDGNFDSRFENKSSDGTREILKKFVEENRDRARMIPAVRTKRHKKGLEFFFKAGRKDESLKLSRLSFALRSQFLINEYRVNQALTFAKMMNMSKMWQKDRWVMSYDSDQFYSDELIDFFNICNKKSKYDLITADEWTFPYDFNNYTDKYELRKWNNMPHKIKSNMAIYPTRHFMIESIFSHKNYQDNFKKIHGGRYYHYKFRKDQNRLKAGYSLGDRKPPMESRFQNSKKFILTHPRSIRRYFYNDPKIEKN